MVLITILRMIIPPQFSYFMTGKRLILVGFLAMAVLCVPTQALSVPPNSLTPSLSPLEEGKSLYEQDRYTEALPFLLQAVQQNGKSARAHYWLGMTLFALTRDEEALKAFEQVVRRDRFWAPGHMGVGLVYLRMPHRRLDARQAMREAMRLDPGNAEYQYTMGMTYMDQGDTDWLIGSDQDGRDYFQRAVELDPQHPDAFYQLGRCYEELKLADHGKRIRDRYDDYIKALTAYLEQYLVNSEHPEALQRFAGICHRFEYYERGAEQLRKLAEEMVGIPPDLIQTLLTQFAALSMSTKKQYDLLQRSLETYIEGLDVEEQAVYRDLVHVAPSDMLKAWQLAEGEEREVLWRNFWNARDSNPATIENERMVEHYKRVMYARIHFSHAQFPYDRRGEVYVRYGEPDDRRRFLYRPGEDPRDSYPPTGKPAVDAIREQNWQFGYRLKVDRGQVAINLDQDAKQRVGFGEESLLTASSLSADNVGIEKQDDQVLYETGVIQRRGIGSSYRAESWVYVSHKMELFFVDQTGGGRFDYPLRTLAIDESSSSSAAFDGMRREEVFHPEKLAEELIERSPEVYKHDFGGEPLDYAFDVVTFRGNGIRTEMELTYSIPVWQFGDVSDGNGTETFLNHQVTLRDALSTPAFNQRFRFGPIERPERRLSAEQSRVSTYTLAIDVQAPPGRFTAAVHMRDSASQRTGVYRKPVDIRDYRGNALMISDLKLSTGITPTDRTGPFVRKGLNIVPHPLRAFRRGQLVYVYYEVYNLSLDDSSRTSFETYYEIVPEGMPALSNRSARQSKDMQTVLLTFEGDGLETEEAEYTGLDTTNLTPGVYALTVTVNDRHSGTSVSETSSFIVVEE